MFRWMTAGESHGQALVAMVEGLPAHVEVTSEQIAEACGVGGWASGVGRA